MLTQLIDRRMIEANMYLNGIYAEEPPANYCYVLLDANRGTVEHRMQGYDADDPCEILEIPVCEGYEFAGWYTEKSGGTKVELLDAAVKDRTLYAQWRDPVSGEIVVPQIEIPEGTQIDPVEVTVLDDGVNLREGPGTNYSKVGEADTGMKYTITAIFEGTTYTWGKFSGGWIALSFTNYDTLTGNAQAPETEPTEPSESTEPTEPESTTPDNVVEIEAMEAVVNAMDVNLRESASLYSETVGKAEMGQLLTITATAEADGYTWGRFDGGWICMTYVQEIQTIDPVEVSVTGDELNLRSMPSAYGDILGKAAQGDTFTVTATVEVDGLLWGRYDGGWLALEYTDYQE